MPVYVLSVNSEGEEREKEKRNRDEKRERETSVSTMESQIQKTSWKSECPTSCAHLIPKADRE